MVTWSAADNLLYHTLVGSGGQILNNELRTNTDSYNVFPDHPGNSSQTIAAGPGAANTESPIGWLTGAQNTANIAGNNVNAYLDTDANNAPDAGISAAGVDFLTVANLGAEPETNQNKEVAVQSLFYFNNILHDKLYQHGFIEATGNFQEDNFGNGGNGSDSVNAEAQDGSGTNNANFSTPSDGSNPRMQMYVWTQTSPKRDGDVDSDIIYHEYGHGLTWRMIGSMSGPMSGAIGEGMSDGLSVLFNGGNAGGDVVGEYSYANVNGIRSAAYTDYPRTYGDMTGSSVHFDGEIYGAIVWKLRELFSGSTDPLWDYVVGGMNFTPSKPSFEDMRDGILAASLNSIDDCLIWEAFAHYGVGVGASGSVKGGGPFGGGKVNINESFSVPAECSGPQPLAITSTSPLPSGQVDTPYSYTLEASGGDGTGKAWTQTGGTLPAGLTLAGDGTISGTPSASGTSNFSVEVAEGGEVDTASFDLTINSGPDPGAPTAPSNLSASSKRPFIQLTWNDNSNNEDVFEILRCVGAGCVPAPLTGAVVSADTTQYKDRDVTNGNQYTYVVRARNAAGVSDSNSITYTK